MPTLMQRSVLPNTESRYPTESYFNLMIQGMPINEYTRKTNSNIFFDFSNGINITGTELTGATISFDTFFGALSLWPWCQTCGIDNIVIRIKTRGNSIIRLWHIDANNAKTLLIEGNTEEPKEKYEFELATSAEDSGIIYPEFEIMGDSLEILEISYLTKTPKKRNSKLNILFRVFQNQRNARENIEFIQKSINNPNVRTWIAGSPDIWISYDLKSYIELDGDQPRNPIPDDLLGKPGENYLLYIDDEIEFEGEVINRAQSICDHLPNNLPVALSISHGDAPDFLVPFGPGGYNPNPVLQALQITNKNLIKEIDSGVYNAVISSRRFLIEPISKKNQIFQKISQTKNSPYQEITSTEYRIPGHITLLGLSICSFAYKRNPDPLNHYTVISNRLRLHSPSPLSLRNPAAERTDSNAPIIFFPNINGQFIDNCKYAYLHFSKIHDNTWFITPDDNVSDTLSRAGLKSCTLGTETAKSLIESCQLIFTDSNEYMRWTEQGIQYKKKTVQLWHGSPIKKISLAEACSPTSNPNERDPGRRSWLINRNSGHYCTISPSPWFSRIFSLSFQAQNLIESGFPRNDVIFRDPSEHDLLFVDPIHYTIRSLKKFNKVGIFAPTFRDKTQSIFSVAISNWIAFDSFLRKIGVYIFIKAHIYDVACTKFFEKNQFTNLIPIERNTDAYPLFGLFDFMISDISSIAIDFLLTKKPIIYFIPDNDEYVQHNRELFFDVKIMCPGPITTSLADLMDPIEAITSGFDPYRPDRELVSDIAFSHHDGRSSERLAMALGLQSNPLNA